MPTSLHVAFLLKGRRECYIVQKSTFSFIQNEVTFRPICFFFLQKQINNLIDVSCSLNDIMYDSCILLEAIIDGFEILFILLKYTQRVVSTWAK